MIAIPEGEPIDSTFCSIIWWHVRAEWNLLGQKMDPYGNGRGLIPYSRTNPLHFGTKLKWDFEKSVLSASESSSQLVHIVSVAERPNFPHEKNSRLNIFSGDSPKVFRKLIYFEFNYRVKNLTTFSIAQVECSTFFFLEAAKDAFLEQHVRDWTSYCAFNEPLFRDLVLTQQAITLK